MTSDPAAENGEVSAAYNPNGSVTMSVKKPGANWLYTWMKDGEQKPSAKAVVERSRRGPVGGGSETSRGE